MSPRRESKLGAVEWPPSLAKKAKSNSGPKARTKRVLAPNVGPLPLTFTASELAHKNIPPQRWLVPRFLPEGVTLLAGAPKSGKSWLALLLALAVATGGDFMGIGKASPADVLYLGLEDSERRLKGRQRQLRMEAQPDGLHYALSWRPFDKGGIEDLKTWLDEHPKVRLVIVDVFGLVKRQSRPNKNIYDEDYAAIREVKALASARRIAVVLLHHTNKRDADDDVLKTVSGSTGLTAAVDAIMLLSRKRNSDVAELTTTGRDVESQTLQLRFDNGRWSLVDKREKELLPTRKAILNAITAAGKALPPSEVAKETGIAPDLVRKTMRRMASDKQLDALGNGRYALPKRPPPNVVDFPKAA